MITEVRNKIYSLGNAVTGLSGKFFFIQAAQSTAYPYGVFSQVANPMTRDSSSKFEAITFQVDLFGKTIAALEALEALVKQKFDDCESTFTLTNYKCTRIEREFTHSDFTNEVFQITIQYKLDLTKL